MNAGKSNLQPDENDVDNKIKADWTGLAWRRIALDLIYL